jgi:hypothetical protein
MKLNFPVFLSLVNELNEQGIPELHLYYTLDNSLEYQGKEPQFLILPEESESMMIKLFAAYPQYSRVSHLIRTADSEESVEVSLMVYPSFKPSDWLETV